MVSKNSAQENYVFQNQRIQEHISYWRLVFVQIGFILIPGSLKSELERKYFYESFLICMKMIITGE